MHLNLLAPFSSLPFLSVASVAIAAVPNLAVLDSLSPVVVSLHLCGFRLWVVVVVVVS